MYCLFDKKISSNLFYRCLSVVLLFTFMSFQNCYFDYSEGQLTQKSSGLSKGTISAHLPTETTDRDKFPTKTNVVFTYQNVPTDSSEIHWNITRGFESIKQNAKGKAEIQHSFAKAGTYDVSATSYKNVQDFLTPLGSAIKRVIIGDQCDTGHILEILLTEGSLVKGQIATFGVKNASQFSDINWKATLPSGSEVESEDSSIEVDLAEESAGILKVEVSGSEADQSECVTYRSKEFDISNTLTPHFAEVKVVDGDDSDVSVTLENNDIYKYEKTTDSRYVSMDIKDAHRCILKSPLGEDGNEGSIDCEDGKIDVTLDSESQCNETIITVRAEYGSQESKNEKVTTAQSISQIYIDPKTTASRDNYESDPQVSSQNQETYYHYCGEDDDFCYFGPLSIRPDSHTGCCSGDNYSDDSSCSTPEVASTPETTPAPEITPTPGTPTSTSSTTTTTSSLCPAGDSYPDNPHCICDSSTTCCPGETFRDNPNHCVCDPATDPDQCQTDCVKEHGAACCKTNEGGQCTGPFCTTLGECTNKGNCHVRDIGDGICRPSCGYLANLQGSGHYGPDCKVDTSDDPHHYTGTDTNVGTTCSGIAGKWGSNWEEIPLIDGVETWEVTKYGGGECCKRTVPIEPLYSTHSCPSGSW